MSKYIAKADCFLRQRISAGAEMSEEQIMAVNGGKMPDKEYLKANFAIVGSEDAKSADTPGIGGFKNNEERISFLVAKGVPVPEKATKPQLEELIKEYLKARNQ